MSVVWGWFAVSLSKNFVTLTIKAFLLFQHHFPPIGTDKPHTCDRCGKSFAQRANLTRHLQSHSVDREGFMCDVCGVRFQQRNQLKSHKLLHIANKAYTCEVSCCDIAGEMILSYGLIFNFKIMCRWTTSNKLKLVLLYIVRVSASAFLSTIQLFNFKNLKYPKIP